MTSQLTNQNDNQGRRGDSGATQQLPSLDAAGSASGGAHAGGASGFSSQRLAAPSHVAANGSNAVNVEVLIRKKHRRHTKRKRALRIFAVVAVVLVLVIGGTAFAAWRAVKAGEDALHQTADAQDIQTADDSVTYDEGRTVKYNGHTYKLNENMVSVVVMGYDRTATDEVNGQNGQADAVMVLALDTQTGKATAIGVPRDSMVDISKVVGGSYAGQDKMQLCLAFGYGDGAEGSAENVTTAVSRLLYNMPMSYYLVSARSTMPSVVWSSRRCSPFPAPISWRATKPSCSATMRSSTCNGATRPS